jgi:TRAP-type C4-dicarboxylate transport system permease small subunit
MSDGATGSAESALALRAFVRASAAILLIGFIALIASQHTGLIAAVGIGIQIVLAAAAVGAALGFVFALPRVLSKDLKPELSAVGADARQPLLGSNTNFEKVSDWLTTIIVGVGLTQLAQIDGALYRFREFLAETARVFPASAGCNAGSAALPDCTAGTLPAVGSMLLILGVVAGFISLYLFTRIYLAPLFNRVERDLLGAPATQALKDAAKDAATVNTAAAENPAVQAVLSNPQPSVEEGLNLMFSLLYRPGGYQQVIDLSGKLSLSPATRRPEYWFYLAAAFGQKYAAMQTDDATAEERESVRQNVLDCARRAVELDPSYKSRLWAISDPEGPDGDLAPFRDDAAFRAIVDARRRRG